MSKEKKFTTKQLVFAAMAIALATVVATVIKLPSLPNGGSVTLFSMLLVTLVGYWYGPVVGITAAVGYGILQFITGPYVVHPLQVIIDFPMAFGALGFSGLRNSPPAFCCAIGSEKANSVYSPSALLTEMLPP